MKDGDCSEGGWALAFRAGIVLKVGACKLEELY
jgi:hypothetical protein